MNNKKKALGTALMVLAAISILYWIIEGANIFTATERQVEEKDELFGTSTMKWEKDFEPGLELMGPIAGAFFIGGLWFMYSSKRDARLNRPV